jgi:hypothetical protein
MRFHRIAVQRPSTIDDDLAGLLKQRARNLGLPFKEVVNRTIRANLGAGKLK